ncbi:type II toxin-antitoxin system CcdA family antitoxin [Roseovarius indicus]|uniref:type II toxin-antitoxin system CcdA family antitoxin n=1 Tax=Roseovarius indicus TaxID=540747 RepID=UPI001160A651
MCAYSACRVDRDTPFAGVKTHNLTIDSAIADAKALSVNVSHATEESVRRAIVLTREGQWRRECVCALWLEFNPRAAQWFPTCLMAKHYVNLCPKRDNLLLDV